MSSSYVVLARKYRPSQFNDVVGQSHIVRTLTNAISHNRIHQAYLFTGSRGIGKTSIARLFAKSIRCPNRTITPDGILSVCNQCASCLEISAGNSVDVIEIDGASNNGVDAVREIRENTKYLPSSGEKKIYIIDEVHMLTTPAFNALLKTLEEPPPHVIFVFATTEPHKIPATILSRCQRFDFKQGTHMQIVRLLKNILVNEKFIFEEPALNLIARAAEGSMRDALSLLDQVIAYAGESIKEQDVRESIGLIKKELIYKILENIFKRNPKESLTCVQTIYESGHDLKILTQSLIETLYFCILSRINSLSEAHLSELSNDDLTQINALASLRELEDLELFFQVFQQAHEWVLRSPQPKFILDVSIIKCATAETLVSLSSNETESLKKKQPTSKPDLPSHPQENEDKKDEKPKASLLIDANHWKSFLSFVRQTRPLLASLLEHSSSFKLHCNDSSQTFLKIFFHTKNNYKAEQLRTKTYINQLQHLTHDFFKTFIQVEIEISEKVGDSFASQNEREIEKNQMEIKNKIHAHPIIQEAQTLFSAPINSITLFPGEKN